MSTLEQRIAELRNKNIARKAAYPISGSLIRAVSRSSASYQVTGGNNSSVVVRIRFTADTVNGDRLALIRLTPIVAISPDFQSIYPRMSYAVEPQAGDGSVVLRTTIATPYAQTTFYIKAVSFGSSDGTFSLISAESL